MNTEIAARSMLGLLLTLGAPLSVAGQNASAPEVHRAEARRLLRLATAPFDSMASRLSGCSGLLAQIAEAQARAGDLAGARETAAGARHPHEQAEALAGIAVELARTRRLPEALELAEQIAALSPKAAGEPSPGRPTPVDGVILNHHAEAIGSVVLAHVLAGDPKEAYATLGQLEFAEYRCAALFAIVVARLNAGDAAGAKKGLEDSKDFRACFTEAKEGDRALIDATTALAFIQQANEARRLASDFRRVLRLFAWMYMLDGIEDFGYLLGMMARAGHQDQVDLVLAVGAKQAAAAPDRVERFVAGLLWGGDLKDARRAAETFPGEETQSRLRRRVAEALAREGDFPAALQVAEPIRIAPLQAVTLATVAALQMQKGGDTPAAAQVLARAIALTADTRDVPCRFRALCRIARAQAAAGDAAGADKSLEQAVATARKPDEGLHWGLFVGELVQTYLEIGDPAGAMRMVSDASSRSLLPQERTPLLIEIAAALAGAGKREEADRHFAETLDLAASEELQWDVCDIAQAWVRSGGGRPAAIAVERITGPLQRALALLGMAKGHLQLANPDFYLEEPESWALQAGLYSSGDDALLALTSDGQVVKVDIKIDIFQKESREPLLLVAAESLAGDHLQNARWAGADLRGADLSGANLAHASLSQADLRCANLSGARHRGVVDLARDLVEVEGERRLPVPRPAVPRFSPDRYAEAARWLPPPVH